MRSLTGFLLFMGESWRPPSGKKLLETAWNQLQNVSKMKSSSDSSPAHVRKAFDPVLISKRVRNGHVEHSIPDAADDRACDVTARM